MPTCSIRWIVMRSTVATRLPSYSVSRLSIGKRDSVSLRHLERRSRPGDGTTPRQRLVVSAPMGGLGEAP